MLEDHAPTAQSYQVASAPITTRTSRVYAALWFAAAALLPSIAGLMLLWEDRTSRSYQVLTYMVLPLCCAALCGGSLGSRVLNPLQVTRAGQALGRGALVAVFSYVLYMLLLSLVMAGLRGLGLFVALVLLLPVYFPWLVGLILLAGALAGWALFHARGLLGFRDP